MTRIPSGRKRKGGESAFARRLLSVVGIDSKERNAIHNSTSPYSKKSTNKSTRTNGTSDSLSLDQSTASWENSFEEPKESPLTPPPSVDSRTVRSQLLIQRDHSIDVVHHYDDDDDDDGVVAVPIIQRRPMQFFPNTYPNRQKHNRPSINTSTLTSTRPKSFDCQQQQQPLVHGTVRMDTVCEGETNDSFDLEPVHRRPQHEQQRNFLLNSNVVEDILHKSIQCITTSTTTMNPSGENTSPPSTPLYQNDHDATCSDFTGVSTQIATNRSMDMIISQRIRDIETKSAYQHLQIDPHGRKKLNSQHKARNESILDQPQKQIIHSQQQQQQQSWPIRYHRHHQQQKGNNSSTNHIQIPAIQEAMKRIATNRRKLATTNNNRLTGQTTMTKTMKKKSWGAKSILSDHSNEENSEIRCTGPLLSTNTDMNSQSLTYKEEQIQKDNMSVQSCSMTSSVGVEIHHEEPTRTNISVMETIFRPRHESEMIEASAWRNENKSDVLRQQQDSSSNYEDNHTLQLRNKLSSETPDPVFCSYPESPSTNEGSFGSDYVSLAYLGGDRSIATPNRGNGLETLSCDTIHEHPWQTKLSQIQEQETALSDSAVVSDSDPDQPRPKSCMNSSFPGLGKSFNASDVNEEHSCPDIERNIEHQESKQVSTNFRHEDDVSLRTRSTMIQNESSILTRFNQTWSKNLPNTSSIKTSEKAYASHFKKNLNDRGPKYLDNLLSEVLNTQHPSSSISNVEYEKDTGALHDLVTGTKKKEDKRDNYHKSRPLVAKKETLSSFLNKDHNNLGTDVKSVRSTFESISKTLDNDFSDDDDDTASVKSLKEIFEKSQKSAEATSEVKKLAAMFESKKNPVNRRFDCDNTAIRNAYAKFEDKARKSKRFPINRSAEKIHVDNNTSSVSSSEKRDSDTPCISVADRIRALRANSTKPFNSRFAPASTTATPKSHINPPTACDRSTLLETQTEVMHTNVEINNEQSKHTGCQTVVKSGDSTGIVPLDGITNDSRPSTQLSRDIRSSIQSTQQTANEQGSVAFTASKGKRPAAMKHKGFSVDTPLPLPPKRSAAFSSSPYGAAYTSTARPPLLVEHNTSQKTSFTGGRNRLTGAYSSVAVVSDFQKGTIEDPLKYTKSLPGDQGFTARKITKHSVSQPHTRSAGLKVDESNSCSDELSDGVTIDVSIAEVSNLTVPTDMMGIDEDASSQSSTQVRRSGMIGALVKKFEVSSYSRPTNGRIPSDTKAIRMRPKSDEISEESFFDKRATLASRWKPYSDRNSHSIASQQSKIKEDQLGSEWDLEQINESFPETATSCSDLFEFDSEWQSFPTTPTKINNIETAANYQFTNISNETDVDIQMKLLRSPQTSHESEIPSHQEHRYHTATVSSPTSIHAPRVNQSLVSAQNISNKTKSTLPGKRPFNNSSNMPRFGSKYSMIVSKRIPPTPPPTQAIQQDRIELPVHKMIDPSSNSSSTTTTTTTFVNMMNRLTKLQEAREMRTGGIMSSTTKAAAATTTTTYPAMEASNSDDNSFDMEFFEDFSSSSSSNISSTQFGGSMFMEALEVDLKKKKNPDTPENKETQP